MKLKVQQWVLSGLGPLLLLWWARTVLVHYLVWFCEMSFIFSHFNPKCTLIKVCKQ